MHISTENINKIPKNNRFYDYGNTHSPGICPNSLLSFASSGKSEPEHFLPFFDI